MSTILADPTERIRLVDCTYLGADRSDDSDADDRVTRLLEQATGIKLSAVHAIGKTTTIEGATLHVTAERILREQGKHPGQYTEAEYLDALDRADQALGDYDQAADLLVA